MKARLAGTAMLGMLIAACSGQPSDNAPDTDSRPAEPPTGDAGARPATAGQTPPVTATPTPTAAPPGAATPMPNPASPAAAPLAITPLASHGVTGTIVPLYTPPGDGSWAAIVAAKQLHPAVPVVAVIDPASGPGPSPSADYAAGITRLRAAGIQVIGYVATGYTGRGEGAVRADIDRWRSFYPQVQGIFFDEESNTPGDAGFYRGLAQYARSQGFGLTVGNPGRDTEASFVGAVDVTLIYESPGLPSLDALAGWHTAYDRQSFGVIPFGTPFDSAFVAGARAHVGYIYLTSDTLPNPWDGLSPYFAELLAALE